MEVGIKSAICDDERHVHGTVHKLMDEYVKQRGISQMDGIEAARILNARGINYKIVMLTSKAERFKEAFKIGAFRFVTKPIMADELFEAVDEVRERMVGMGKIQAYRNGILFEIVQRDILYLMADGNMVLIFTEREAYRSEKPLREWINELDKRMFFVCHRSYIVNIGKIAEIEKEVAILNSGEKVPIARRKRSELQQSFMVFDTRRR